MVETTFSVVSRLKSIMRSCDGLYDLAEEEDVESW
jgi:hypothetical protein